LYRSIIRRAKPTHGCGTFPSPAISLLLVKGMGEGKSGSFQTRRTGMRIQLRTLYQQYKRYGAQPEGG